MRGRLLGLFFCDFGYKTEDKWIDDSVNSAVPLYGGIYYFIVFQHRQVLADNRLAFSQTGPKVCNAGLALMVNQAEEFEPDRMAANL